MFAQKFHRTFTTLIVAATTAAIIFYSEQAMATNRCWNQSDFGKNCDTQRKMDYSVFCTS